MFRMEGGKRECEQGERWGSCVGVFDAVYAAFRRSVSRCFERGGERWISSGLVLTRFTQRSGAVFRGVWRYIYS